MVALSQSAPVINFNRQCWYQSVKAGLEGEFAINNPTADTSRQAKANCVNQPGLCDLCWHCGLPNTLPWAMPIGFGGPSALPRRLWIGFFYNRALLPWAECQSLAAPVHSAMCRAHVTSPSLSLLILSIPPHPKGNDQ